MNMTKIHVTRTDGKKQIYDSNTDEICQDIKYKSGKIKERCRHFSLRNYLYLIDEDKEKIFNIRKNK
jgi:hypothetical protein